MLLHCADHALAAAVVAHLEAHADTTQIAPLECDEAALTQVSRLAAAEQTGARGLLTILERTLRDHKYVDTLASVFSWEALSTRMRSGDINSLGPKCLPSASFAATSCALILRSASASLTWPLRTLLHLSQMSFAEDVPQRLHLRHF